MEKDCIKSTSWDNNEIKAHKCYSYIIYLPYMAQRGNIIYIKHDYNNWKRRRDHFTALAAGKATDILFLGNSVLNDGNLPWAPL